MEELEYLGSGSFAHVYGHRELAIKAQKGREGDFLAEFEAHTRIYNDWSSEALLIPRPIAVFDTAAALEAYLQVRFLGWKPTVGSACILMQRMPPLVEPPHKPCRLFLCGKRYALNSNPNPAIATLDWQTASELGFDPCAMSSSMGEMVGFLQVRKGLNAADVEFFLGGDRKVYCLDFGLVTPCSSDRDAADAIKENKAIPRRGTPGWSHFRAGYEGILRDAEQMKRANAILELVP